MEGGGAANVSSEMYLLLWDHKPKRVGTTALILNNVLII